MGNKNKKTKPTNTGMSSNSSTSSTNKSEDPTVEDPMDLLQKLTTYIQREEKDSSTSKREIQALKQQLQESQDETRTSKLSTKTLEKAAKELRDINKTQAEVTEYLVKDLQEEGLKYQKHKVVSQGVELKELGEEHGREIMILENQLSSMRQEFQVAKRESEELQNSNRISDDPAMENQPRQNAQIHLSEDEDDAGNLLAATSSALEESRTASNQPFENKDNFDIALILRWNTKPRDEVSIQQIQVTNALEQKMDEKISLLQEQLAIAKTEMSKEQMKTLRNQESIIVSHNMVIADEDASQIFSAMCQEYNDAAESDKKCRKVEWKKISV
ncbi:hypothetical protein EYC80_002699 [Monilinia laxa]|uniref:Uncharacterized protein n=1 Tax=Monilinia laxa TaxID=61186 RepID=A0A5N6K4V9_MONLA|nr:hypothetical protein EYC80_002699 [Monilinia laxa]